MLERPQKKLSRIGSPRVHITYDVEIGGAIVQRELPLIVGVLSELSGNPKEPLPPLEERGFIEINKTNFDGVLDGFAPRLTLEVNDALSKKSVGDGAENAAKKLTLELIFETIDDFSPLRLVQRIPAANDLLIAKNCHRDFLAKLDGNHALKCLLDMLLNDNAIKAELTNVYDGIDDLSAVAPSHFMKRLFTEGQMALDESQEAYALTLIGQFTNDILGEAGKDSTGDAVDRMGARIAHIDTLLTRQINWVMHEPAFQKLEASWRGLHFLVMNTATSAHLKVRVLNASQDDLLKDIQKNSGFDRSALFKKLNEEFGTDDAPYSLLVGDYEFGRQPEDIDLLENIAGIAAATHAPFIAAAYVKLFDLHDGVSSPPVYDPSKIFDAVELRKWRSFRDNENSRYVSLALPKVLLRLPYAPATVVQDGFCFAEAVDGTDASCYLWGNPSFVLAQRMTNAFAKYGWLAAICGVDGGGLVEGLPVHGFKAASGNSQRACPTQIVMTDRCAQELDDLGFMAILHDQGSDKVAFFGGQATGQPKKYHSDTSSTPATLPYILNASRFAHYIKVMLRAKAGSFLIKDNVSDYLNTWISSYVLSDDDVENDIKARYPLREAKISVTDIPGRPGAYQVVVLLKPCFQLDVLTTSIRLVVDIPGSLILGASD